MHAIIGVRTASHTLHALLASVCVGLQALLTMMTASTAGGLLEQISWVVEFGFACTGAQYHGPGAAGQADTAVHCHHAYQG